MVIICIIGGCASTVLVEKPPRFIVSQYENIGIIDFSSKDEPGLSETVTQKFIQNTQQGQPGTAILELGDEKSVLASIKRNRLDADAMRLIGRRYGVDAVITGKLNISESRPRINITNDLTAIRARVEVEVSLNTKMVDTTRGATVWVATRSGKWPLASISGNPDGIKRIGVSDLEAKYNTIISELVYAATEDFRPRYVRASKK
jgi:hypothetical protein